MSVVAEQQVWIYHRRHQAKVINLSELKSHEDKGWTTKRISASTEIEDLRQALKEAEADVIRIKVELANAIEAEDGYATVKKSELKASPNQNVK